jgi:uncharacterized RDD family membrane protein YckC
MREVEAIPAPTGAVCAAHPNAPAILSCERCGNFCGECCAVPIENAAYCRECASRVPRLAKLVRRLGAGFVDAWLVLGVLTRAYRAPGPNGPDDMAIKLALFATAFALSVLVLDAVLIATREQTVGMLFFGTRFALPDGGRVGTLRLLLTRLVAPMVATLASSAVPVGIPLAAAVNFGCMRPWGGQTLVDRATRTIVVLRKPRTG